MPDLEARRALLPEKLGGMFGPDIKAAILLRSCPQRRIHLRPNSRVFDNATTKWNESGALSLSSSMSSGADQGPMPMKMDRLQQKGKDKGKSKREEQKDKSKGKSEKGKCFLPKAMMLSLTNNGCKQDKDTIPFKTQIT